MAAGPPPEEVARHPPGDRVARYGGEEFAVILPDAPLDGALVVAERIRAAVAALELPAAEPPGSTVSVSIGAATLQQAERVGPRELIQAADAALYQAKPAGRNCVAGLAAGPALA
ncbi:GGDEF domain-containing protein [Aquabacterium sp. A7-Y]|uniref:GGDEF domain-containing protein n=1 Tax=Aquabacterium sp. A7-Y TaxID=1349605 RepID=UPI00223DE150|nr:GGDEF domain-containing protein [Aquabacterium sp. A7-Y]MCW7536503.1 GGDEF domain-containing protein [Aquabacterium sp. A7-Y]